jgi:hypothetical protein
MKARMSMGTGTVNNDTSLERRIKKISDTSYTRSNTIKKKADTQQDLDYVQAQESRESGMRENKKTVIKSITNLDGGRRDGLRPMPANVVMRGNHDDGKKAAL